MEIRVGLLSKFFPETGIALYSQDLLDELKKRCHAISIGWGESKCDYKVDLAGDFIGTVKDVIQRERLNILHIQYITSGRYLNLDAKFKPLLHLKTLSVNMKLTKLMDLDIKKVVTFHEVHTETRGVKDFLVKNFEGEMSRKADKSIVHGKSQIATISNDRNEAVYIPYGLHKFDVTKKKGKNILFQGRINPEKGLEYLIDAMKQLPDFNLVIKGEVINASYAKTLEDRIAGNNLGNIKIGYGWISEDEKSDLYEEANFVVLPYLWAPYQSGILNEAFSYKVPVVVTRTKGPIEETVKASKCGLVVNVGNSKQIAEAVKKIYRNYSHYLKNINRYRNIANWPAIADRHIKLYKKLLKTGS